MDWKLMKLEATDQPALCSLPQRQFWMSTSCHTRLKNGLPTIYFDFAVPIINCKLMKLVATDQPALFILPQIQFAPNRMASQVSQQCCNYLCTMYRTWCESKWPNILSTCKKIKQLSDTAASDVYPQQFVSLVQLIYWQVSWVCLRTPLMSIFGVALLFRAEVFRMLFRFCILRGTFFFFFFLNG